MAPKEAQWSAVTNHRPRESTGESDPVQINQLKRAKPRMTSWNAQLTATESCWFIFQVNMSMFSCCVKKKNKIQLQFHGSSPRQDGTGIESYENGCLPLPTERIWLFCLSGGFCTVFFFLPPLLPLF